MWSFVMHGFLKTWLPATCWLSRPRVPTAGPWRRTTTTSPALGVVGVRDGTSSTIIRRETMDDLLGLDTHA